MALQQAGNVKYFGWHLKIACRVDMVDELQQQARMMERELEDWRMTVRERRDNFYELNNYTTLQLLSLRETLGALKDPVNGSTNLINPSVLALLQSITPNVTVTDVVFHVTQVLSECRGTAVGGVSLSVNLTGSPEPVLTIASPNQPSELKDGLKSVDKQASSAATHPVLTLKELDEKQKAIYFRMVDYVGFCEQLVLKALQECDDVYLIEIWCTDHETEFEDSEVEKGEEVVEGVASSEESDSDQDLVIYEDVNAESRYLSLKELGIVLEQLSHALPCESNYRIMYCLRGGGIFYGCLAY